MNQTESLIAKHEGLRLKPYTDTVGKLTIGYGRNLDDNGITKYEAELMLTHDVANVYEDIKRFEWFTELDEVRQAVVVNMVFNLGINRFMKFKNTIMFIEKGLYTAAAEEMLDSKWARQVGNRAQELSLMMRSGEWL